MRGVGPYAEAWSISQVEENDMNPIIAAAIAAQRHDDLLAAAHHSRVVHRARAANRTPAARPTRPARTIRVRPVFAFHSWLAAGRL
jgi:hypothetical protein